MDADGFVTIMARTDDVINVAGHRISTKALEEVREAEYMGTFYNTFHDSASHAKILLTCHAILVMH